MEQIELKYKDGSVWLTIDRLRIFDANENGYVEGDFIVYFSFRKPSGLFYGEILKNDGGKPYSWKEKQTAEQYARDYFKNLFD